MKTETLERTAPSPSVLLKNLEPYDAVSSLAKIESLNGSVVPLKLDWNESSIPPSPRVIEAIVAFLSNSHHLNWYPDLGARKLRAALSKYTKTPEESILVTNGSDDALDLICRTYVDSRDDIVVAAPTYGHFLVFVRARGVEPRMVTAADTFERPTERLLEALRPETKLVYIASPNNPTGVVTPPEDMARLCSAFPRTVFLVDEAYYEFCGVTSVPLVGDLPNLVITRTFSKCYGIAGLRVGYLVASQTMIQHLLKLYNPKSVNALGQVGALAALSDTAFRDRFIFEVRQAREWVVRELTNRGALARSTPANFILVRVDRPKELVEALETVGVFVRDRSHIKGFEGYVRITIGTMEQMKDLISRLDYLLSKDPHLLEVTI